MKLRNLIGTALVATAFIMASGPALAATQVGYSNDFQKSLEKFVPGSNLDQCVTPSTLQLMYEKDVPTMGVGKKINGYAQLTDTCIGGVWMMASLTGTANSVAVEFDAKSVTFCEGCVPLVYVGTSVPKALSQFTADYTGLERAWQKHIVKVSLPPVTDSANKGTAPGTGIVVAISFTALDSGRSVKSSGNGPAILAQQIGIDNVRITLDNAAPLPANN